MTRWSLSSRDFPTQTVGRGSSTPLATDTVNLYILKERRKGNRNGMGRVLIRGARLLGKLQWVYMTKLIYLCVGDKEGITENGIPTRN